MRLFRWLKRIGGKRKYVWYDGMAGDQMALDSMFAKRVGRPLPELVTDSLSYMFEELGMSHEKCEEIKRQAIAFATGQVSELPRLPEKHHRFALSQFFHRKRS